MNQNSTTLAHADLTDKIIGIFYDVFEKQLLNYLRGTNLEIGLILNFGPRAEFRRLAYSNERKKIRVYPRTSAAKTSP